MWGLKIATQTGGTTYWYGKDGPAPHPHAAIVREYPWMVTVGIPLLLLGLALQVVVAAML